MQMVPYSFNGVTTYPRAVTSVTPGQNQGVYISLRPEHREMILDTIMRWFRGREDIDLVCTGVSDKVGLGYIILEWVECEIDQLFLDILGSEDVFADYTTYVRDLEV